MRAWCCKLSFKNIFLLLSSFFIIPLYSGTGLDSFAFLKIKSGARGASLGDGFVAVAGDVSAASYNPASIASLESLQLSLMHLAYIADTSYEYITLATPINKSLSLGVSVIYFSYGSMNTTTENSSGTYTGTGASFTPYDILGAVTVGYKLNKSLNLGVNLKYVMEDISGVSISSFLADAGVLFSGQSFGAGLSIFNLGSAVKNDKVPMGLRGGISLKTDLISSNDLILLLGGNYGFSSQNAAGSAGVEYCFDEMFLLRGSYAINTDAEGLSLGAGFKSTLEELLYSFDYNFNMLGDLGSAHRISLTVSFGGNTGSGKSSQKKTKSGGVRYSTPARSR